MANAEVAARRLAARCARTALEVENECESLQRWLSVIAKKTESGDMGANSLASQLLRKATALESWLRKNQTDNLVEEYAKTFVTIDGNNSGGRGKDAIDSQCSHSHNDGSATAAARAARASVALSRRGGRGHLAEAKRKVVHGNNRFYSNHRGHQSHHNGTRKSETQNALSYVLYRMNGGDPSILADVDGPLPWAEKLSNHNAELREQLARRSAERAAHVKRHQHRGRAGIHNRYRSPGSGKRQRHGTARVAHRHVRPQSAAAARYGSSRRSNDKISRRSSNRTSNNAKAHHVKSATNPAVAKAMVEAAKAVAALGRAWRDKKTLRKLWADLSEQATTTTGGKGRASFADVIDCVTKNWPALLDLAMLKRAFRKTTEIDSSDGDEFIDALEFRSLLQNIEEGASALMTQGLLSVAGVPIDATLKETQTKTELEKEEGTMEEKKEEEEKMVEKKMEEKKKKKEEEEGGDGCRVDEPAKTDEKVSETNDLPDAGKDDAADESISFTSATSTAPNLAAARKKSTSTESEANFHSPTSAMVHLATPVSGGLGEESSNAAAIQQRQRNQTTTTTTTRKTQTATKKKKMVKMRVDPVSLAKPLSMTESDREERMRLSEMGRRAMSMELSHGSPNAAWGTRASAFGVNAAKFNGISQLHRGRISRAMADSRDKFADTGSPPRSKSPPVTDRRGSLCRNSLV